MNMHIVELTLSKDNIENFLNHPNWINCLIDIQNGSMIEGFGPNRYGENQDKFHYDAMSDELSLTGMALNVRDAGPDGYAEKWGVDLSEIATALEAMSIYELSLVRAQILKFWEEKGGN